MYIMIKPLTVAVLIVGSLILQPVLAYEGGDFILRVGLASVQPNDDSDPLALNGAELSTLGLGLPVTELQVEDDTQIGITFTYMFNSNWGLGVLASTPFEHDIRADALSVAAGSTEHLPPTFTVQYFPMAADSEIQPYVGAGLNYTTFFSEEVDNQLNTALAGLGATGNADLSLDDSFGLALEAGFDYKLNEHWLFNAAVWYINIETSAEINVPGLGQITTDVTIDPWVYMISAGYLF